MKVRAYLINAHPAKKLIIQDRNSLLFNGYVLTGLSERNKQFWDREILKVSEKSDVIMIQVRIRKRRDIING